MNRPLLLLLLCLAVLAGAIAFFPSSTPEAPINGDDVAAVDLELAVADGRANEIETKFDEEEVGQEELRSEIEASYEELVEAPTEEPYAMLEVRLFGESDEALVGATAGILLMPEPGQGFEGLQSLFFAMQGQAPPSFPLNETFTDENGKALLPLPDYKYGWVVYGRLPGRLIGFQVVRGLEPGVHHDAGVLVLRRGGTLRVEVVDEKGNAIAEASVVLVANDDSDPTEMPIHFLRTDEEGIAEFSSLSFETYKMEVAKHGYLSFHLDKVAITERGTGFESVTLPDGGVISGRVIDQQGQPIPGVQIFINADEPGVNPEGLTQALLADQSWATTNDLGQFNGSGLSFESTYSLRATRGPGVEEMSRGHRAGDDVTIKMSAAAKLSGVVLQADGAPASYARLALLSMRGGGRYRDSRVVKCDLNGAFESLQEVGQYFALIHHPTGELILPEVVIIKSDLELAPIKLPLGGAVNFEIFEPDGTLCERVFLTGATPMGKMKLPGKRNLLLNSLNRLRRLEMQESTGRFQMQGLTTGPIQFRFYAPEFLDVQFALNVKAGEIHDHQIYLEEGGTLNLGVEESNPDPETKPKKGDVFILTYVDPVADQYKHLNLRRRLVISYQQDKKIERLLPGTWALSLDSKSTAEGSTGAELSRFIVHPGVQTRMVEIP